MKTFLLLLTLTLLSLTGCVRHIDVKPLPPQNLKALLAPTVTEDRYSTMQDLMADPKSVNQNVLDHGTAGDSALQVCNSDKAAALKLILNPPPEKKTWSLWEMMFGPNQP